MRVSAHRFLTGNLIIFLSLAFVSAARDQAPTSSLTKLVSLKFDGLVHFTDSQATAVSGLHENQIVSMHDLQLAADRLAQSGGFANVGFRYSTSADGISVEFSLTENQNLIPCVFDNFVWFSDAEIDQALRENVPLYGNTVPEGGPTMDQISAALRVLLQSKSISGDVQRIGIGQLGGKLSAMSFREVGVPIYIREVSFPGADATREKELLSASAQLIGRDYVASETDSFSSVALVPLYRHEGYFRVKFSPPTAVIQSPSAPGSVAVSVAIPVQEGPQYRWDAPHWTGNQTMASSDLDKTLGMVSKEVADADKINKGFESIRKAYSAAGYIDAAIVPSEQINDADLTVSYNVKIEEGIQYHMGQLSFVGASDKDARKLAGEWELKPGAVYNGEYFQTIFLKKASWPKSPDGKAISISQVLKRNPQTATVDLTFTLR